MTMRGSEKLAETQKRTGVGFTPWLHLILLVAGLGVWAAIEIFDVPIGAAVRSLFDGAGLLVVAGILIAALLLLLGGGVWVAVSLMAAGFIGMALFTGRPVGTLMATTVWGSSNSWALAALPLFIWMGEILFRSRLSEDMFAGLAPWMKADVRLID